MADDPSKTQQALALAAGTIPGILARLYGPDANSNVPPELRQMLAQQTQRSAYQNPLFEAVTGQALGGLPEYAKAGHSLGPSMGSGVPPVSGGGSGGGLGPLAAGGLGAALGGLLSPNGGKIPLGELIKGLINLFRNHPSLQRDKPNAGGALTGGGQGVPGFEGWDDRDRFMFPQWGRDPNEFDPFLQSDPGSWYGPGGESAYPTDPSGGTGVGPGMQDYNTWLREHGGNE